MIDGIEQLRGTSADKIAHLLQLVRSDGKASLALGVAERLPIVGETVRFILYDVPAMPHDAIDALLDRVVDVVRCLQSDAAEIEGGDE